VNLNVRYTYIILIKNIYRDLGSTYLWHDNYFRRWLPIFSQKNDVLFSAQLAFWLKIANFFGQNILTYNHNVRPRLATEDAARSPRFPEGARNLVHKAVAYISTLAPIQAAQNWARARKRPTSRVQCRESQSWNRRPASVLRFVSDERLFFFLLAFFSLECLFLQIYVILRGSYLHYLLLCVALSRRQ
jgi:hypothetical protein